MNKRITIQQRSNSVSSNGFETESWTDYKTVWAGVSNLFGREFYAAATVQAENTVKFTIRYLSGITSDMRIVFQGRYFDIKHIDNIKYGNKFMEIKAMEVI